MSDEEEVPDVEATGDDEEKEEKADDDAEDATDLSNRYGNSFHSCVCVCVCVFCCHDVYRCV
jgi:hypothetical protein